MTLEEMVERLEDHARRQSWVAMLEELTDLPLHDLADSRDLPRRARAIFKAMTPAERAGGDCDRDELHRIAREAWCDVADVEWLVRSVRAR